jgi:hypothetical protein
MLAEAERKDIMLAEAERKDCFLSRGSFISRYSICMDGKQSLK